MYRRSRVYRHVFFLLLNTTRMRNIANEKSLQHSWGLITLVINIAYNYNYNNLNLLVVLTPGYQMLYRMPQSYHLILAHQLNLSNSHSTIPSIYGLCYSGQFPQTARDTIISENHYIPNLY